MSIWWSYQDTGSLNHFAALSLSITYLTSMIVLQRKRRKYDMVMPHLGSVATGIFSDHRIRFMLHSQIPTGGHPFLESVHGGLIVKMCKLDNRCDMWHTWQTDDAIPHLTVKCPPCHICPLWTIISSLFSLIIRFWLISKQWVCLPTQTFSYASVLHTSDWGKYFLFYSIYRADVVRLRVLIGHLFISLP